MDYFKDSNGRVFAYDSAQVAAGLSANKTAMTAAEISAHLNPPKTADQLREEWKASRAAVVEAIKVTTQAGNTFDGDETSQSRMSRAIIAINATAPSSTVRWVLADNSVIQATSAELAEALALAGAAQAAVWVQ